jgi:SOS-response transcriptional repressor LexA
MSEKLGFRADKIDERERMGRKTGKVLELQVTDGYRSMPAAEEVEHDVQLGGHQIDVYVKLKVDRCVHRIAIEAKDWQSPVGKDVVSRFALIVDDLRRAGLIDEGIIVSTAGFSKQARAEAAEHDRRGLTMRLVEFADLQASAGIVPIIGVITAGERIPVLDSRFRMTDYETITLPRGRRCSLRDLRGAYALRVKGKSMIDALVDNGDIIVVRPQRQVLPREMAVIWLREDEGDEDGGTTLKYFYREPDGRVRLQPANPTMRPTFIDPRQVEVQARV